MSGKRRRFEIETLPDFERKYKRLVKKNQVLERKIRKTFKRLSRYPFEKGLDTHKVNTKRYGWRYSSRVTGDLRIIWDFVKDRMIILALTLGGHEGGRKVYR